LPWESDQRLPEGEIRSEVVGSIPGHASNFSTPDCTENQQGTLSQDISNLQ